MQLPPCIQGGLQIAKGNKYISVIDICMENGEEEGERGEGRRTGRYISYISIIFTYDFRSKFHSILHRNDMSQMPRSSHFGMELRREL